MDDTMIHSTAEVNPTAIIGKGTRIWHQAQVREGATIGEDCIIGKGVYIGVGVHVGGRCKIQNYACLYSGVTLGERVFVGPHACFTNDARPRAVTLAGELKKTIDWTPLSTIVENDVSIGANVTILPGITLKKGSMIGAGAVVTQSTMSDFLYTGNPARPQREL